ncbi:GNAT family N-acetyltransferase [Streptomyces kronopolitis]|uniref:GNAT family N-acetyltransferase n=1 Tax=Streptomyces kronopolitis TaxID=1612435 RepID=UPI003794074A
MRSWRGRGGSTDGRPGAQRSWFPSRGGGMMPPCLSRSRLPFPPVARADGGEVLGRAGLRRMDLVHGEAECAYWVLPQARGTGVAPRALTALAAWALDEAGFHRLELAHSTANEPSCRVAAKCGFTLEGTRRSAHRQPDGWHDMHLHARIQGDC